MCQVECEFLPNPGEENTVKGTRHSEEQIITILKQGEAGLTTTELCRQHGITEQTYYRWKAKYGGMDSGEAKKLKHLEEENRKLKHVVELETLLLLGIEIADQCGEVNRAA
jgi:putative transposase